MIAPIIPQLAANEALDFDAELTATIASRLDDFENGRVQGLDYNAFMARMQVKIDAWEG